MPEWYGQGGTLRSYTGGNIQSFYRGSGGTLGYPGATGNILGYQTLPLGSSYRNWGDSGFTAATPAPPAPHLRINFDTIGQTIVRSIGHCRLPLQIIWAQGIEESGDESVSPTQTFAGALCAPLDPDEDGEIFSIWDSDTLVMNAGASIHPIGWSAEDAALLSASLAGITIFPGDEAQIPASVISADKGASRTNAFRGIRYVIVPNYPIFGGGSGGGGQLPNLNFQVRRRNDGEEPEQEGTAVEFLAGGG